MPLVEYDFTHEEYIDDPRQRVGAIYLVSDFILVFMFTRFYIMIRNAFNHTEFSDPYAKLHCERHGFTANTRF